MSIIKIQAEIKEIKYHYTLQRSSSNIYSINDIISGYAFRDAVFRLKLDNNIYGISQWVSPKRTRSYPFARVYDTGGIDKKITIIPLVKDEGSRGDRDYLQWDTISLMSLLNVNVIICWYDKAKVSSRFPNKITLQEFSYKHIIDNIQQLRSYQSDALHWNIKQIEDLKKIASKTRKFYYEEVPKTLGIKMHGVDSFDKKIEKITKDAESFRESSRSAAKAAQHRESLTIQPKEKTIFNKGIITVKNWIGGIYYWTVDELVINGNKAYFIEKKHGSNSIPSIDDIKDGFLKQVLYSNISVAKTKEKNLNVIPVIGLTGKRFKGLLTTSNDLNKLNPCHYNLSSLQFNRVIEVFYEACKNGIYVFITNSDLLTEEKQLKILSKFA